MNDKELEILVVGAGGIGGITAAHMSRAGYNVEVADNWPGLAEKIRTSGIRVFGKTESFTQQIPSYASISDIKDRKDLIIIATKANSLCQVAGEILKLMKDDSVIISMQNGICEEYLANVAGREKVIGCVVGWGATVHQPGVLEKTSHGDFTIGTLDGKQVEHFDSVVNMLSTVAPVTVTENILGALYAKLVINSCITTLGAVCGLTLGKMLSVRKIRKIFIGIISEAVSVGKAAGIRIEKYAGKLDFYNFAEKNSPLSDFFKHLKIRIIGLKYRRLKSSSLQSLETGRKTEIDYLNGYITQKGKEKGVRTPLNDLLVSLIKEIESGKREISFNNFGLVPFNQYN